MINMTQAATKTMEEIDIFHPFARVICKKCCKLPIAFDGSWHAVYNKGSVYVKSSKPYEYVPFDHHRVYNYSTSDDTWDISPIKFQDSFKALAIRNDRIVLVDAYKEQAGKEFIRIFPLSGDVDATQLVALPQKEVALSQRQSPLKEPSKDASQPICLSVASDKNKSVIVYSSVNVLVDQSEQIELTLDLPTLPGRDDTPDLKYHFRSLLYDNHLYLSPTSAEPQFSEIHRNWYYIPLHQLVQQTDDCDEITSPDGDSDVQCLSPPQPKKARLDRANVAEWKHMPQVPHDCSNLAQFGKQLVTVHCGSGHGGIEILAYSTVTGSWVAVAETDESLGHRFTNYSSIVYLDDTGELMVIEGGSNYRDVYRLSIEVSSYDPKSEITLQALCKLEAGAAIPVLTKLESELLQFRKRANIRELYAFKYARNCPVVDVYINSWLNDSESVPSTWGNFLVILKDIGPKDIADDISSFLSAGASITEQGLDTEFMVQDHTDKDLKSNHEDTNLQGVLHSVWSELPHQGTTLQYYS